MAYISILFGKVWLINGLHMLRVKIQIKIQIYCFRYINIHDTVEANTDDFGDRGLWFIPSAY